MFVDQTLLDDLKTVLSRCADSVLFRRLSDAVRLASSQSKDNDWNVGQMDLCVCDGCVTLPADVATILGVNNGGFPTLMRDQWFQYHINGSGTTDYVPWRYTDELGPVVTIKDPSEPVNLVCETENSQDAGKILRVFGWDENGKRIYTTGADGVLQDGFLVPTIYGYSGANPEAPAIARIDRIQKEPTNGFLRLLAVDTSDVSAHTLIGHYMPWGTVPSYRRIRVPDRSWLRIKYRRNDIEVRGMGDWINIENREALLLLVKAVKFRLDNQLEQAKGYELEGMRLLSNDAHALKPNAITPPQIIVDSTMMGMGEGDRLFY